ncbi:MAG: diguanylate cyclase [Desulfurivibrio sp.]|nr:diguanylate cyclase [Desulfurivibrio sp.]
MSSLRLRRLTPLFLGLLVVLLIAGTCYRYLVWQGRERQHLEYGLDTLQTGYQAGTNMFALATGIYFNEIIKRPEVYRLMAAGLAGQGRQRDLARGRLYRLLYPTYERLRQSNLRHLHFHFPDCTSFLRFHRPEGYGDFLGELRPSIRKANARLEPIHGFEVGRTASASRNVFPLIDDNGRHLGSVEMSVPFKSLRDELAALMPKREFSYILDRATAQSALRNQLPLYGESALHPGFLVKDSGVELPGSLPPPSAEVVRINEQLRDDRQFQQRLPGEHSFARKVMVDNQPWAVNLLRIYDVEQQPVGYLLSYAPDDFLADLKREFMVGLLIAWSLAAGLGLLFVLLARSRDEMMRLATTDPLTNLANRRSFMDRLSLEQERFKRFGDPVGFLMLDLDFFKEVNDTHGHHVGDEVLRQFAALTRQNLRHVDLVGRLGGEEFAVILPGADLKGALHFAERLRCGVGERLREEVCGHRFPTSAGILTVTVSIGVAVLRPEDEGVEPVLHRADTAMYRAKENGRNRIEVEE